MTSELPPRQDFLGLLTGGIKWFGASLAALTAFLYIAGYLLLRAHLNLLGFYGFINFGHDDFLQEGAKFFAVTGYALARAALLMLGLVTPFVVAFALIKPRVGRWLRTRHPTALKRLSLGGYLRPLIFSVVFVAFLSVMNSESSEIRAYLCVDNLLYSSSGASGCLADAKEIVQPLRQELLASDQGKLNDRFENLLTVILRVGLLTAFALWLSTSWRHQRLLLAPFVVGAATLMFLLPLTYGVIQRAIRYPRIDVTLVDKTAAPLQSPLFLLSRTGNEFVLWSAPTRSVVWLPASAVSRAEVTSIENPLVAASKPIGGKP